MSCGWQALVSPKGRWPITSGNVAMRSGALAPCHSVPTADVGSGAWSPHAPCREGTTSGASADSNAPSSWRWHEGG